MENLKILNGKMATTTFYLQKVVGLIEDLRSNFSSEEPLTPLKQKILLSSYKIILEDLQHMASIMNKDVDLFSKGVKEND